MPDASAVLIIVDVQNSFMPGGSLAVPRGDEVVPVTNALAKRFANVILTQDSHPAGHRSFASSHPGRKPSSASSPGAACENTTAAGL
jgi:nicotinamidase/pyrazinamidase